MGRHIDIIAIFAIPIVLAPYRIDVYNIVFFFDVSYRIGDRPFFGNFAYFFCLVKRFRVLCGSVISTNLSLVT